MRRKKRNYSSTLAKLAAYREIYSTATFDELIKRRDEISIEMMSSSKMISIAEGIDRKLKLEVINNRLSEYIHKT